MLVCTYVQGCVCVCVCGCSFREHVCLCRRGLRVHKVCCLCRRSNRSRLFKKALPFLPRVRSFARPCAMTVEDTADCHRDDTSERQRLSVTQLKGCRSKPAPLPCTKEKCAAKDRVRGCACETHQRIGGDEGQRLRCRRLQVVGRCLTDGLFTVGERRERGGFVRGEGVSMCVRACVNVCVNVCVCVCVRV